MKQVEYIVFSEAGELTEQLLIAFDGYQHSFDKVRNIHYLQSPQSIDTVGDQVFTIAVCSAEFFDMFEAISEYRQYIKLLNPKFIVQLGFIAGNPKAVKLGDVIIPQSVTEIITTNKISSGHTRDSKTVNIVNDGVITYFKSFDVLEKIKHQIEKVRSKSSLHVRIGNVVSIPGQVIHPNYLERMDESYSKFLGYDVTSLFLYNSLHSTGYDNMPFIIMKGVTDFATKDKSGSFTSITATAIAYLLKGFVEELSPALFNEDNSSGTSRTSTIDDLKKKIRIITKKQKISDMLGLDSGSIHIEESD
jgi:hypothetical protein